MSQESLPVGLARDDAGATPAPPAPIKATSTTVGIVFAALAFSAVAGGFRRLTAPAELATLTAGTLVCWLALRKDCRRYPAPRHLDGRGTLVWGIVLVVFAVWELYADFRGSTPAHPTLSILMGPVIAPPENRAIGYILWLASGVWLVRR